MTDPAELEYLAAEYVLGTLDDRERSELNRLRQTDAALDAEIVAWEKRLGPLAEAGASDAPPAQLRTAVLTRIKMARLAASRGPQASGEVIQLRRQIRVWRSTAAAVAALAAALALWILVGVWSTPVGMPTTYMAVLQSGPDQASFVVSLDLKHRLMTVVPSSTPTEPGKSYELWMINADQGAPISLGVLDPQSPAHPKLPEDDMAEIVHATYAVTMEQPGGSPTGQPTSKPVFVGRLIEASR